MYPFRRLGLALFLLVISPVLLSASDASTQDPAAVFAALEQRLLDSQSLRLSYHAVSQGAFEADIRGELSVSPEGVVKLSGSGHFGGQAVELLVHPVAQGYEYGNGDKRYTAVIPPALKEALLIGLTRMGILHNLAMLSTSAAPDHSEGGVREWVVASEFGTDAEHSAAVAFDVIVAGTKAARASLELDGKGLPLTRRQSVQFPQGEMRVVENYSAIEIAP